jgi:ABC-type dipeptide/oligopeptide/nickel transport system permease subunit
MTTSSEWVETKPRSLWKDAARTFAQNKAGMFGLLIVVLLFISAIFAPVIAPYDPLEQDWDHLREPPSWQHPMGTDELGRDMFSRILYGARTAVLIATLTTTISTLAGVIIGSLGAYLGGWVDAIVVWVMDALMNFPAIWLAAFISVTTRPTINRWMNALYEATQWEVLENTIILDNIVVFSCLALVSWPGIGRLVRGQVLSLREKEFIEAQHAIGASPWWVTTRHLVPNVLGSVVVAVSGSFGGAMLAESALSFLGLGIRPPGASWGTMIASSINLRSNPHLVLTPGLALSLVVLAFTFVGDALNDALNPRARRL